MFSTQETHVQLAEKFQPGDVINHFLFLSQQAGDEIVLVKRIDDDWYVGRLGDQQGMFPAKFVEIIEDLPREKAQQTQVKCPEIHS